MRLGAAIGDPALFEGTDDLRKGMALFALVEPGVAAPTQFRAVQPVEHGRRAWVRASSWSAKSSWFCRL